MSILSWFFGSNEEEERFPVVEPVEDDTPHETAEERHAREWPGICGGCGHPIDDHPNCCPTLLCCQE